MSSARVNNGKENCVKASICEEPSALEDLIMKASQSGFLPCEQGKIQGKSARDTASVAFFAAGSIRNPGISDKMPYPRNRERVRSKRSENREMGWGEQGKLGSFRKSTAFSRASRKTPA